MTLGVGRHDDRDQQQRAPFVEMDEWGPRIVDVREEVHERGIMRSIGVTGRSDGSVL
jgi:hypothetical protein